MNRPTDIYWDDKFHVVFADKKINVDFSTLRYLCPCAACVDELSGVRRIQKSWIKPNIKLANSKFMGNYAIRLEWDDGHNTGLYTFDYLFNLPETILKANQAGNEQVD